MDSLDEESSADTSTPRSDRPLVAIPTTGNSDAIAGLILRARDRGHDVVVVSDESRYHESLAFADRLDAAIVTVDRQDDEAERKKRLRQYAKQHGFPGVIYHEDPGEPIDFERSSTIFRESNTYLVESQNSSRIESKPTVLAAIPAYNEASTIDTVVKQTANYVDKVMVIDDGSDDDTAAAAREAGAVVIEHEQNRGYGAALKTAFRQAEHSGAAHLAVLDGDGQHDPADIQRMVTHQQRTDAEVVVGCRFDEAAETDIPLYRRFGIGVVNLLTNLSLGVVRPSSRVRDTQNGFRAYDRRAIKSLAADETLGDHMGASTDILHHAHANDYDIEEVGTTVDYDVENGSSHSPLQHGLTLVSNLLTTIERERPLLVLAIPGFVVSCIGIGFGYWTFANYINTTTFPLGLAVTSVFFTLSGIFSVFTGIILHALKQHLRAIDTGL
ncbi:glycosyltransferase family 2 protein [Halorientalis regularis]|uniref:Glycosyl transferase family 2 n=1 Tax=Halorientalis regularis TaxID=660518 RepID=A0A1G7T265_9EURY|nr:glycosyltransferase family 2 protein [Halorientalis regularis]SDG29341.1 Glycosyl transferase family 2 [Halorientalis regularis]